MAETGRGGLRRRVFLAFALLIAAAGALIGAGMWLAAQRIGAAAVPHLTLGGGAAWFGFALIALRVWQRIDERIVRPLQRLGHELEREATPGAARGGIETAGTGDLGALGPAAARLVAALARAREDTAGQIAAALRDAEAARMRLETVLRDLNEAVIVCDRDHRILLYNHEAVRLLGEPEETGLGRPLSTLLVDEPIRHALERLERRFSEGRHLTHPEGASLAILTATASGTRTLAGRIALILDAGGTEVDGFAITFADATATLAAEAERDHLLAEAVEALTPPVTAMATIGEILAGQGEIPAETRRRLELALARESHVAADHLSRIASRQGALTSFSWPMADVFSRTLFACLLGRLGPELRGKVTVEGEPVWLHAESFTIAELLATAIRRISTRAEAIALTARRRGGNVFIDMMWAGEPISFAGLEACLAEPLERALGRLTGRDVLLRHRTEVWSDRAPDGRARLRLPLRPAIHDHAGAPATPLGNRPEFYDFDLMNRALPADQANQPLRDLSCVVFDTETTGLNPTQGDEIVQIAGVRIVNGRLLSGEVFDELVDPGRPIPAASTRVHKITNEMVAGRPPVETVLKRFHAFSRGHVLIAHNAAFDMRFLSLKERAAGVRFDNPVLDTVLLSALISDPGASHTLDALAGRFGITLKPEERHTALGDAIATASAFLRMLDLLAARGITTLAEAQEASDTMVALRRRQKY